MLKASHGTIAAHVSFAVTVGGGCIVHMMVTRTPVHYAINALLLCQNQMVAMRKPVPSHGNLDHFYLKQLWTNKPIPRAKSLYSIGTPEQFRQVLRDAIFQIDASNKKQPTRIPMEDIEL